MSKDNTFNEKGFGATGASTSQRPRDEEAPARPSFRTNAQGATEQQISGEEAIQEILGSSYATASSTTSSGDVQVAVDVFNDILKKVENKPGRIPVQFVGIDTDELYSPMVVMYAQVDGYLHYVSLILERFSKPIPEQRIHDRASGRDLTVIIPTIAYWDEGTRAIVDRELVARAQGIHPDLQITDDAAMVIPRHLDIKVENANEFNAFFDSAYAAILANINIMRGQPTAKYTTELFRNPNVGLTARYDIRPGSNYRGLDGNPIFGDFNAVLYARSIDRPAQDSRSIQPKTKEAPIASLIGYMDFIRADVRQDRNQQGPVPGYIPVVVVTSNSCLPLGRGGVDSLLSQLLSLSMLAPLIDSHANRWALVFEPFTESGSNPRNIGALGLEYNPYSMVDFEPAMLNVVPSTERSTKDQTSVADIVATYCTKTPIVAMDILQGGPLQYLQETLALATPGSEAEKHIIAELDAFSGDVFSEVWTKMGEVDPTNRGMVYLPEMLIYDPTSIYAGHYPLGDKPRDIRAMTYTDMLEVTQGDQRLMEDFANGFLEGTDTDAAMDLKLEMIRRFAPNSEITGQYRRIFPNPMLITAISIMLEKCKITITTENLGELTQVSRRGYMNTNVLRPVSSGEAFRQSDDRGTGSGRRAANWLSGSPLAGRRGNRY
ncbi:MAG: hypothetical protein ACXVLT_05235 [Flavisolibacter sp.]